MKRFHFRALPYRALLENMIDKSGSNKVVVAAIANIHVIKQQDVHYNKSFM